MSDPNYSNEGHVPAGFPRPIVDADNAMRETCKMLKLLNETLTKIVEGCLSFHVSVRFWPPGLEGRIEVKK